MKKGLSNKRAWGGSNDPKAINTLTEDFAILVCGMLLPQNFLETAAVVWIGAPREPHDFVKQAAMAGRPKKFMDESPGPQVAVMIDNLLDPCWQRDNLGLSLLKKWEDRKNGFEHAEFETKKNLDSQVAKIIAPKQTILLEQLLREYEFPDKDLVSDIRKGLKLTGWLQNTGFFVPDVRPPKCSVESQASLAKARNTATLTKLSVKSRLGRDSRRGG